MSGITNIFEDLVEGSVNDSLTSGVTARRVFLLENVQGNPNAIMFNAIQNGSVPKKGDPHPSIPIIRVDSVDSMPAPGSSNNVRLIINYKALKIGESPPNEESETQITLGGTIQNAQTNKQVIIRNGKEVEELIILKYTFPVGKSPDGVNNEKEVVPVIEKQVPNVVASLSRQETTNPLNKAVQFLGRLNSRRFLGTAPFTWMCTQLGGPSNDSGETYQVAYEFQFAPDGWNTDVLFTEPDTGRIPSDVESQRDAVQNVRVQKSADFNKLKLPV